MMAQGNATLSGTGVSAHVRTVSFGAPLRWLRAGLSDLLAAPSASLFYGLCLASMGFLLFFYTRQEVKYIAALTSGFLLVGPFVAIGLYEISRRHERKQEIDLGATSIAWHENANSFAIFGLILGAIMLLWTGIALTIFAAFYGSESPTLQRFIADVMALNHLDFLVVYSLAGSIFAGLVFAISVVSMPMMLDRNCDPFTAARVSLQATARNLPALALWAVLITALTLVGLWSLYLGLIVTMPLVAHASWHAYREMVEID